MRAVFLVLLVAVVVGALATPRRGGSKGQPGLREVRSPQDADGDYTGGDVGEAGGDVSEGGDEGDAYNGGDGGDAGDAGGDVVEGGDGGDTINGDDGVDAGYTGYSSDFNTRVVK